jgi:hypothetical protein
MLNPRDLVLSTLYNLYSEKLPNKVNAPEVGQKIADLTWAQVRDCEDLILFKDAWTQFCKDQVAARLKNPPEDDNDSRQIAFKEFATPENEKKLNEKIGCRRYRSPVDGMMVDLVDPAACSSRELYALADSIEQHGRDCVSKAKYVRQLAKLRKIRGF